MAEWIDLKEACDLLQEGLNISPQEAEERLRVLLKAGVIKHKTRKNKIEVRLSDVQDLIEDSQSEPKATSNDQKEVAPESTLEEAPNVEPTPEKSKAQIDLEGKIEALEKKLSEIEAVKEHIVAMAQQIPEWVQKESSKVAAQVVQESMQQLLNAIPQLQRTPTEEGQEPIGDMVKPPTTPNPQAPTEGSNYQIELIEKLKNMSPLDKLLFAINNPGFANLLSVMKMAPPPQQPQSSNQGGNELDAILGIIKFITNIQKEFTSQTLETIKAYKELVRADFTPKAKSKEPPKAKEGKEGM